MGIRVAIVVGDLAYRAGLMAVINSAGDMECCRAYASSKDALPEIVHSKLDVVLMVVPNPPLDLGERMVRQLRAESPSTAVIAIADSRESQDIQRVLSAGVLGYLLKSSSFSVICDAIRQTIRGGSPLSPEITPTVLKMFRSLPIADAEETISAREQQIIELLRVPARNKEIAASLRLSVPTVRTHLRTLYLKLRVHSRSEAIRKLQARPAPTASRRARA
jgi:DNA-binding NarL/FixJ family response regulator